MGAKNLEDLCLEVEEKTRIQKLEEVNDLEFNVTKTQAHNLELLKSETETQPAESSINTFDIQSLANNLNTLTRRLDALEAKSSGESEVLNSQELKLLDKKVTQVLQKMIKSSPGIKKEALMIKKLISEFAKKAS